MKILSVNVGRPREVTWKGKGDRFRIGSAEVMVTAPRMPCFKLGLKFERDDIIKRFLAIDICQLVSNPQQFYNSVYESRARRPMRRYLGPPARRKPRPPEAGGIREPRPRDNEETRRPAHYEKTPVGQ
jgi:hypothetical protein